MLPKKGNVFPDTAITGLASGRAAAAISGNRIGQSRDMGVHRSLPIRENTADNRPYRKVLFSLAEFRVGLLACVRRPHVRCCSVP